MKNLTKTILTLIAAGLVTTGVSTQEAQAAKINGTIGFGGSVQFDQSSLQNVKAVTIWRNIIGTQGFSSVSTLTGNFSSFVSLGDNATMSPWTFNPSSDTNPLWSVGGFTFHLLSSHIVMQTPSFLNITGTGTISGNGFDTTNAKWAFTIPNATGTEPFLTFAANNSTVGVPDGGSTVALLGISLVAIEFVRRKLRFRA